MLSASAHSSESFSKAERWRVESFHRFKKKTSRTIATKKTAPVELQQHNELKKEQFVNPSQVFNAALGAGAAALIQNVFTPESKKPATKEDLANLASGTKRYHLVKNRPPNQLGQYLYFDLEKGELVYLNTFK